MLCVEIELQVDISTTFALKLNSAFLTKSQAMEYVFLHGLICISNLIVIHIKYL